MAILQFQTLITPGMAPLCGNGGAEKRHRPANPWGWPGDENRIPVWPAPYFGASTMII
jgi:hypothetical protein